MQHGHKEHQEVPQEVEPAMGSWKTKYLVWERVVSFTSGIIGQEGKTVAGKGGHVGITDNGAPKQRRKRLNYSDRNLQTSYFQSLDPCF